MQAHAAGWDTLLLFGVGPQTGMLRGDLCGILIPCSVDVHEVTAEWIKLGIRIGAISPSPVVPALLADWPAENLPEACASGRRSSRRRWPTW